MDTILIEQLKNIDLNEKEAIVYLTLLELGKSNVQQIADTSRINRSTIYMLLESLLRKGFIQQLMTTTGAQAFVASDPKFLLEKAEALKVKSDKSQTEILSLIPELNALSSSPNPMIRFYEGKEGIETVQQDIPFSASNNLIRSFSENLSVKDFRKTNLRVISSYDGKSLPVNGSFDVRYIPSSKSKYAFHSDMTIYDDKIQLISTSEEFAVIVEDKYFSTIMKEVFDLAWEEAGRLDSKIRKSKKK